MTVAWAALLAAAATATLLGLPRLGALRVQSVLRRPADDTRTRVLVPRGRRLPAGLACAAAVLALLAGGGSLLVPLLLTCAGAAALVRVRRVRALAAARHHERSRAV